MTIFLIKLQKHDSILTEPELQHDKPRHVKEVNVVLIDKKNNNKKTA